MLPDLTLFENNPTVNLLIDPGTGGIVEANQAAVAFYGYSVDQLKSMRIHDLNTLPEADVGRVIHPVATSERSSFVTRHRLASGSIRDVEAYTSLLETDSGRIVQAVILDVTEKRAAERRYRALFEQSNDAISISNLEGTSLQVNQRSSELFGYSTDELLRMANSDLVAADDQAQTAAVLRQLLTAGTVPPYERTFRHRDGHLITAEVNTRLIRDDDGQPLYIQNIARDISARKQMENDLRHSEENFRLLVEQSRDGVVLVDETGRVIEWNASQAQVTGIPAEQAQGQFIWDVQFRLSPDNQRTEEEAYSQLKAVISNLLQTEMSPVMQHMEESVVQRPDGTRRIVEGVLFPIRTERGHRFGSILRDVTERHAAEERLRMSELRYRSALDASLDAYYLLESVRNADGEITDFRIAQANDKAVSEMHLPRETCIGGLLCDLFPTNWIDDHFERFRQVVETGQAYATDYEIPPDGPEPGFYHHQIVRVGDGVAIMNHNITARKQVELALRESESRLKMIVEGTRGGTWEWNVQTGETVFNERWAEMLGYTLAELAPVDINTWRARVHPDDLAIAEQLTNHHFAGLIPYYECEVRMRHQDGHWVWVWDLGRVTKRTEDGRPLRMLGMHLDISERKRVETALRESEQKYRLITEHSSDGIAVWDTALGQLTYVSPAYDTMMGRAPGTSIGRSMAELFEPVHPDDRDRLLEQTLISIQQQQPVLVRMYRERHADGHYIWKEDRLNFQYDASGNCLWVYSGIRDITRRRMAELALEASEEKYRLIAENTSDGIAVWDQQKRKIIYASPAFDRMFSRTAGESGNDNLDTILAAIHPDDQAAFMEKLQVAVKEHARALQAKYRALHRDGHYFWKEDHLTLVYGEDDSLRRIYILTRDISERVRMEDTLRENEEKYRLIAENSTDGIVVWDMALGQITYASPVYDTMMGRASGTSIGWGIDELFEIIHPDDRERVREEAIAAVQQQLPAQVRVYRERHADGHYVWKEDHLNFHYDANGNCLRVHIGARDVTKRRLAEIALEASEAKYRLITENIRDVIFKLNPDGIRTYVSPSSFDVLGYRPEEVTGANAYETIHPEDWAAALAAVQEVIREGKKNSIVQHRLRHQNGSYLWVETALSALQDAQTGQPTELIGVTRDISERRLLESQTLELGLEKERIAMLTQFIQDASHEFRTPLSVIASSAYLLSKLENPEKRQRKLAEIDKQIKGITRLVEMLLMMVRLESGQAMVHQPVDLQSVLDAGCQRIQSVYVEKPVIQCVNDARLPVVMGDVDHLSEALLQLLDNACRYTPADGQIVVTHGSAEGQVWLEIANSGPGIEADDLPHIFKTFWRKDLPHSTAGLGLGLPIAQQVIQRHGGTLTVESHPGQVTRVRIILPLDPPA